jgi:hypothetical protein
LPSSFSLILLGYRATGTLKWATRYANRYADGAYAGGAFGGRIVLGPGGRDLYIAGTVWVEPDTARGGKGVTP